ncbi:MAG: HNH endonuclease, partial [Alphaproteobacteria bacterium]
AAPDPTSPDTQSDEPLTTLEKAKLAVAVKEAEDKAKKIKLLFEEGQATDDNEASTEPGICLLPEYQIFYDAYDPTYPYKEAKISGTKEPGILEGRGKTAVRYIKEIMAEYNQFAQDNPKLARYALSAISMTLKTTIGAIQGAIVGSVIPGVGTIIGAISSGSRSFAVAAVDEVRGEVIAAVAGDEIAAGIQKGAELTAPALMKADSTLSKDEAELLVKFTALATMSSHDLAQGMKTLAKTVKPKHAFAEGIDIDDYHGKNSGDSLDDIAVFKDRHDLLETVQKVGSNYPRNAKYAEKVYLPEDLPESIKTRYPDIKIKYPDGVKYDAKGYPDFTPYTTHTVKLDKFVNYNDDFRDANKLAGLKTEPKGYTWHHHQDRTTMQLVPEDLHSAFQHTGGMSTNKHGINIK